MFHAPKDIYGPNLLQIFIDELGGPKKVCKYLDVSERTVWHWLSTGRPPRAAVLALYWETQFGRDQIFTEQVNEIRALYRTMCMFREQFQRAKDIVAGLRKLHTGTANEPIFEELPDIKFLHPDIHNALADQQPPAALPEQRNERGSSSKRARKAIDAFDVQRAMGSR